MALSKLDTILRRLERSGDQLDAEAIRVVRRAFRSLDLDPLLGQIAQALALSSPLQRLQMRERLTSFAAGAYPQVPAELLALAGRAIEKGGQATAEMLGSDWIPSAVAEEAQTVTARLQGYWGASQAQFAVDVGRVITQALTTGEGGSIRRQLVERVGVARGRASMIARTETLNALNTASHATAQDASERFGFPLIKEWRSASDIRVRSSHRALNGQRRAMDEDFKPGLGRPHDPRADASETIHCRCTLLYITELRR